MLRTYPKIFHNSSLTANSSSLRANSTVTSKCTKYHYDSLGLDSNATQDDIKAAYYELSKIYHPDKSTGSKAENKRFREISEAYEVLRNTNRSDFKSMKIVEMEENYEDPIEKFYKSREHRSKLNEFCGKMLLNDYDKWARRQYSKRLRKDIQRKKLMNLIKQRKEEDKINVNTLKIVFSLGFIVYGVFMFI